ncbi:MAG: hypothetical protein R3A52_32225 [Polyangiales bacterium]
MSAEHAEVADLHARPEDADYARMREYDQHWNGPKFVGMLVVTLAIALTVIYGLASIGSG